MCAPGESCQTRPGQCDAFERVCGCDGKTYGNDGARDEGACKLPSSERR
ncbi:hypothetical protein [Nannocystis pusilla]|uniref:Kazal-like domain-containing protein n=1 Tax=Nannocystis pusilla TaxID=889268 RepID=A0ABS7TKB6_9BACT|nr:hypothetical protein [Nannocystis pusilla]MBZ5708675.1 hypothetical protein [Nannocystis pusilla]